MDEPHSYSLVRDVDVVMVLARMTRGKVRATVVHDQWEGGSPYSGTTAVR